MRAILRRTREKDKVNTDEPSSKRLKPGRNVADERNVTSNPPLGPYSICNGVEWQPCSRPFENNLSGVDLNFNWWMGNASLLTSFQMTNFIVDLLNPSTTPQALRSFTQEKMRGPVIIVAVHGIDPISLAHYISELSSQTQLNTPTRHSFFQSASCMPVRHNFLKGVPGSITPPDDKHWRYAEVEAMNSLILWPERPSLPVTICQSVGVTYLLSKCVTVFTVRAILSRYSPT